MSKWTQEEFLKEYAKNLKENYDEFTTNYHKDSNRDLIFSMDQNDQWGMEARIFSICFQQIRNFAGPYKIFGTLENQYVGSCIRDHTDAWRATLRNFGVLK
jgi:hypothetical protein